MKNCTKCGEINTTDTNFCIRCGNNTFVAYDEIVCPKCGMANTTQSVFCIGCGHGLPVKKEESSVIATVTERPVHTRVMPVEESDDSVICTECGAKIKINDVFCTNCGNMVAESSKSKIIKRRLCPKCNRPNHIDSEHCSYCFASLENGEIEEYSLDFVEAKGDNIKQAVLVSISGKKSMICPNCNTANDIDAPYCVNCGYNLSVEVAKKYCLICGTESNYDAKFCIKCQYAFSGRVQGQIQGSWKCGNCMELNEGDSQFCSKCGAKRPKR